MGPIHTIADFVDMLRRRVGLMSAIVIAGCFGSVFWALSTPHLYESSEVIQISQPTISDELARPTVEGSAARRVQLIQQQLLARDSLEAMIATYALYENLPGLLLSQKVDLLRRSVTINGVAAVREGFADDGALSVLTITVQMDSGEKAQDVASAFADQTRELAAAQRQEQTRETLAFFQSKENAVLAEIKKLDGELATFRQDNDLSIEGSLEFRRTELGSLNDALLELDREIISAELQLETMDRSANVRAVTVEREEQEILRELASLGTQRELLQARRSALSDAIETTPEVERALAEFERRRELLTNQLDVITTRRAEAEVGFSLESASRGERFTTLEEARVPDYPITMSRKNRVVMGVGMAGMAALGLAFLLELRRPVIRTAAQMKRETGLLPVVAIPETTGPKYRSGLAKLWQEGRELGQRSASRWGRKT
ncbi:MAG: DUF874 domain-containing protein [Pseudomonadota bacterium]